MHASRSWINRIPRARIAPREIVPRLAVDAAAVDPDCGLKTRGYPETVAALQNLVEATRRVRDRATVSV